MVFIDWIHSYCLVCYVIINIVNMATGSNRLSIEHYSQWPKPISDFCLNIICDNNVKTKIYLFHYNFHSWYTVIVQSSAFHMTLSRPAHTWAIHFIGDVSELYGSGGYLG